MQTSFESKSGINQRDVICWIAVSFLYERDEGAVRGSESVDEPIRHISLLYLFYMCSMYEVASSVYFHPAELDF